MMEKDYKDLILDKEMVHTDWKKIFKIENSS